MVKSHTPSSPGSETVEAPTLSEHVNTVKDAFVDQLGDTAQRIKALSPKSGALSHLGKNVQSRLVRSEDYLRDRTAADLVSDLISLVRRHPLPFVLGAVGAGIGLLVSGKKAPMRQASTSPSAKKRPMTPRASGGHQGASVTH